METFLDPGPEAHRERCYGCYRPVQNCFCDQIPRIENRTGILILQHMRERSHPFNTARIVHKALDRCELLVDHNHRLAERISKLALDPSVALLYPGDNCRELSNLAADDRPKQLIIIDGTWHHAKTLLRDIPMLSELPRFKIVPDAPGNYRIRREPNVAALSTLEATVNALTSLEPDTYGVERLVEAFNSMVETQLAHPKAQYGWRVNRKRSHNQMAIPRAICGDLQNIVVAYGESEPGLAGDKRSPRACEKRWPIYWVAQRLGVKEESGMFRSFITPRFELEQDFLRHLKIDLSAWGAADTIEQFRRTWNDFMKPNDVLAVYHQSTLRLLSHAEVFRPRNSFALKSVKYDKARKHKTLDAFLNANEIESIVTDHPGRAGERLGNAIALVHHLREIAPQNRE